VRDAAWRFSRRRSRLSGRHRRRSTSATAAANFPAIGRSCQVDDVASPRTNPDPCDARLIGSKADSEIRYRFDEKPMQPLEARILRGLRIFVIENKTEVMQFLDGLATANALYIQIRFAG
jgi:hypothetical protein